MKVFVATGTQLPFDRLIRTLDEWAADHPEVEFFAQIGPTKHEPQHLQYRRFLDPEDFARHSREADLHVTHAGTGSIFGALELEKTLIVMPRLAKFSEHRNDHQLATVDGFKHIKGINIAYDETQLIGMLDDLDGLNRADGPLSPHATEPLLQELAEFINDDGQMRKRDRLSKFVRGLLP